MGVFIMVKEGKLKKLLDGRNVIKDKNNLYSFKDGPLMKKFNDIL